MKKISKVLLISLSILFLTANYTYAQLGVQAGYAYSSSKGNLELGTYNEYSGTFRNSGFQGGLTYDFKIDGELGMHTGILYSFFAGKTIEKERTINNIFGNLTTTSNYHFLDLPIRVTYSLPVTNDFKIFFFAGPNLTYNLSGISESVINGKITWSEEKSSKNLEQYDVYKDFENDLLRFDLKAGFGGGVQYKQLGFKIGYDFGILNGYTGLVKTNSNNDKYKVRRGQLGISIYFLLWK